MVHVQRNAMIDLIYRSYALVHGCRRLIVVTLYSLLAHPAAFLCCTLKPEKHAWKRSPPGQQELTGLGRVRNCVFIKPLTPFSINWKIALFILFIWLSTVSLTLTYYFYIFCRCLCSRTRQSCAKIANFCTFYTALVALFECAYLLMQSVVDLSCSYAFYYLAFVWRN